MTYHETRTFLFILASIWKWHAIFIYSIYGVEETTSVKKPYILLVVTKEKELH